MPYHRSEEHTSELQSHDNLVCRLLLEKKKDRKSTRLNSSHKIISYAGFCLQNNRGKCRKKGPVHRRSRCSDHGAGESPGSEVMSFFFNVTAAPIYYPIPRRNGLQS